MEIMTCCSVVMMGWNNLLPQLMERCTVTVVWKPETELAALDRAIIMVESLYNGCYVVELKL